MGIKVKYLIASTFFFFYLSPIVVATGDFSLFVDQHFKRIESFQSNFHQIYYDSLRESRSESSGTLRYAQPGRMHWTYVSPDELEVYIGGKKIWIVDPLLENVTIQELDKVTQMNALSFLLDKKKLRKHFIETLTDNMLLDKTGRMQHLILAPRKESQNLVELQIGYDYKSYAIKQFVIIDAQKNHRKITFSKVLTNVKMDLESFEFQVPEEMEIIDGIGN